MSAEQYAEDVLVRARETLQTARCGYADFIDADRRRRMPGLRNLITFARSVTFVLQNMSGHVPGFDEWYGQEQERMRQDPLMSYFKEARNILEKQGRLNVSVVVEGGRFTDLDGLGSPPPNHLAAFIGDTTGGSGWEVLMPDGSVEKYYVTLPPSMGQVTQKFTDFPETSAPELQGLSIEELCALYLQRLDELLVRAEVRFLGPPPAPKRPHLRLVK